MITADLYSCYAAEAGMTCDGTSADATGLFSDLQKLLGTSSDGTLRTADLAAYQAIAARYGLPAYMNLFDVAAHADEIAAAIERGAIQAPGFGPGPAFWGFLGVSVVILGGVFYAGRRGYFDRVQGRTRRGRYK